MSIGQEWRPTPKRRESDRAEPEKALGERMDNVEKGVSQLSLKIENLESNSNLQLEIMRDDVHHIRNQWGTFKDEINEKLMEFGTGVSDAIKSHAEQEEKTLDAKFESIVEKIGRVSDKGEERNVSMKTGFRDLKVMYYAAIAVVAVVIGFFGAFVINHGADIAEGLHTLKTLKTEQRR